jgi:hypothetical protein
MSDSSAETGNDLPEWVPDAYDPDAPLRERLPLYEEVEAGELVAIGRRGYEQPLGQPKGVAATTSDDGPEILYSGGRRGDRGVWKWEIVAPPEDPPFIRSADADEEYTSYADSRKREMEEVDVRIHGVDDDRLSRNQGGS